MDDFYRFTPLRGMTNAERVALMRERDIRRAVSVVPPGGGTRAQRVAESERLSELRREVRRMREQLRKERRKRARDSDDQEGRDSSPKRGGGRRSQPIVETPPRT